LVSLQVKITFCAYSSVIMQLWLGICNLLGLKPNVICKNRKERLWNRFATFRNTLLQGAGERTDVAITSFWVKVKDKAAEQGEQADTADGFQQSGNLGDSPLATALTVVATFWFWSWRPAKSLMASTNKP
jgi:hypothetical protein